jgi:hypothetical protein
MSCPCEAPEPHCPVFRLQHRFLPIMQRIRRETATMVTANMLFLLRSRQHGPRETGTASAQEAGYVASTYVGCGWKLLENAQLNTYSDRTWLMRWCAP